MDQNTSTPQQNQPPSAREYTAPERLRVITGIILCILLAALDQTVVLPAIPQMAASLRGAEHLSWVVSAYLLTATATTPIYGKLSDQFGRRVVLVPALVFFLLACVFCALSTSVPMLITGRALQGIGGGALMAVSQSAVADVISPRERGKYQAWFAGTWAFASVAGPIAGGYISQHFSWRWIFWGNLPLGLVAMVLCIRGLAGLAPAGLRSKIDYAGAALMVLSVSAILLALSSGGIDYPWLSGPVEAMIAVGIAASILLFWQQKRAKSPLFPAVLLKQPVFRNVLEISIFNSAAMFGAIFLLPLMFQWLYHASPASSGLDLVPFLAIMTVGAFIAGRVTRATGRSRPIMALGVAFAVVGFALLAIAPGAGSLAYPVAMSSIFGLGMGFVNPSSLVAAQSQAGRQEMGAATAMLLLTRAMGGAFGATMAGTCLAIMHPDLKEGFSLGFAACAVLQAMAVLVALRMAEVKLRNTLETIPAKA